LSFVKYNVEKIGSGNEKSDLAGVWEMPSKDVKTTIIMNLPNDLVLIEEESVGVVFET